MSSGQLMALIMVARVMVAGIVKARIRYAHKYGGQESGDEARAARAEAERLREEVKQLKERLHVLERITAPQGERLRKHARCALRVPVRECSPSIGDKRLEALAI